MWQKIKSNFCELNLDFILGAGQSFRWTKNKNNEWNGVLSGIIWTLKQDNDGNLLYLTHNGIDKNDILPNSKKRKIAKNSTKSHAIKNADINYEEILKSYFNLDLKLEDYYSAWCAADENFKQVSKNFKGIRILRQDPIENLFSFICSANNNITRISSMVGNLCSQFGRKICEIEGISYHAFPSVESLAQNGVEFKLRELGFGYRAKYIYQAAKFLKESKPPNWLESLKTVSYEQAHNELVKIPGIGAKVADCICLMSLDKYDAVPVDTHIWQVTVRDYLPHLKSSKTLNSRIYNEIGDFYRERFGKYAGWANTVLFAADLKKFQTKI